MTYRCAVIAMVALAPACLAQSVDKPEDKEKGLLEMDRHWHAYGRVGVSYGWAGDQQVYGAQPIPPDAADFQDVWGGSVATGIDWGVLLGDDLAEDPYTLRIRTDFEIGYEALFYDGLPAPVGVPEDTSGVLSSWTFIPNVFLDLTTPGPFSVFAGAGIGLGVATVNEDGFSSTDTAAVWQWMAGGSALLKDNISLYAQYRVRTYLGDLDFDGARLDDLSTGAVEIGLRFDF